MRTFSVRVYAENDHFVGEIMVEIEENETLIIGTSPRAKEGDVSFPDDISTKASYGHDCFHSEATPYEASVPILVRNPGEAPKLP